MFGVYGQLKIKKIRVKSFLNFKLSSESFRMPETNLGHIAPPLLHNVIPELALNRVNFGKTLLMNQIGPYLDSPDLFRKE